MDSPLPTQRTRFERIEKLNAIGAALSSIQDYDRLLELILLGAKELTCADGGTLYLVKADELQFSLVHTTSLSLHMGGTSAQPVTFPRVPLYDADGCPNLRTVASCAVHEDRIINIRDAYAETGYDFSGTKAFDANTGYRSKSFLTAPMKDHENRAIGVLQLINAQGAGTSEILPFSDEDEGLICSLASQAAISLNRQQLINGLEDLLHSLTQLIANTIDDKSPQTGSHCRRVPEITMAIARSVHADCGPVYGETCFNPDQLKELEMAAWLHDCGKMTTPEHLVDKQTKLQTVFDRIELIETRLDLLRSETRVATLEKACPSLPDEIRMERDARLERIDEEAAFLRRCNKGEEFMSAEARQRLMALATTQVPTGRDRKNRPLLNEEELASLSVIRGTLTDQERILLNNHAEATLRMLKTLPFRGTLKNVPRIAAGHHERMDGRGYPQGIPAGTLPLQARILAIADIFEALTARDRSYRQPNTLAEALTIMARMTDEGQLDPKLFDFFVTTEAYREYAERHLQPEQRDCVDTESLRRLYLNKLPVKESGDLTSGEE